VTGNAASGLFIWHDEQPDEAAVSALSNELGCPRWFASVLVQRGIADRDSAQRWLNPMLKNLGDPFALPDTELAADRILAALDRRERITIFGDYDVDGLTSVALLHDLLTSAGGTVEAFLPLRMEEGYGLSNEALVRCIEETTPNLIITVDCGTNSVASVKLAREHNVDVIITDHHEVGQEKAPALAVVNPRLSDDATLHVLAGVGVSFKLVHAILKRARQLKRTETWVQTDPRVFLDLVALGTIADIVPLIHENRVLVHHGLKLLNGTKRTGILALIEVAGITKEIDTYEVGYLLGPRLNASGRLGNARKSLQLLLSRNPGEAKQLAAQLDAANRERQQVERAIVEELKSRIGSSESLSGLSSMVEAEADWHPGVVGIVASRLVQQYHRPAVVIGMDDLGRAKGSCRSIPGFNMVEALDECRDLLAKYGGHAMAAGLEIEWSAIPAFRQRFDEVCRARLAGMALIPHLRVQGWLGVEELNQELITLMEKLRPFGMGHPEPLWAMKNLTVVGTPREVGKGHLKVRLASQGQEREAIGFGMFSRDLATIIDSVFHIRLDTFRGRNELVLHLKDFRASL
jgi:single-stranded-DNA-specific exonuclease